MKRQTHQPEISADPVLSAHRRRGALYGGGHHRPAEVCQPPCHAGGPHHGIERQGRAALSRDGLARRLHMGRRAPHLEQLQRHLALLAGAERRAPRANQPQRHQYRGL